MTFDPIVGATRMADRAWNVPRSCRQHGLARFADGPVLPAMLPGAAGLLLGLSFSSPREGETAT